MPTPSAAVGGLERALAVRDKPVEIGRTSFDQITDLDIARQVAWEKAKDPLQGLLNFITVGDVAWYYAASGADYFSKTEKWKEHAGTWDEFITKVLGKKHPGYINNAIGYYRWMQEHAIAQGYLIIPSFRIMAMVVQYKEAFESHKELMELVFRDGEKNDEIIRGEIVRLAGRRYFIEKTGIEARKRSRTYLPPVRGSGSYSGPARHQPSPYIAGMQKKGDARGVETENAKFFAHRLDLLLVEFSKFPPDAQAYIRAQIDAAYAKVHAGDPVKTGIKTIKPLGRRNRFGDQRDRF